MATLETAFEKVKGLVYDFKANELYYLSSKYSEAEVREDYINKFFVALGWDVRHKIQKNPYEQEVKVEKGVKVGRAHKRADYAFHLAPNFRYPVFYVEAKKPARVLSNPDDYLQAIRYCWNANTPIVILTDFEEFHIIDSRFEPDINTVLNKKLKYFHYSEYADKEKFAEIYYLFSREAVGNNSIEKYAESLPKPKGKAVKKQLFPGGFQSIDESFLEKIDEIRITLARAFKKSNPSMQGYELTEAIHRTIDRLVFIRFLEDKLIEPVYYINDFGESSDAWDDFVALSKRLNAKYNGVVFKHHFIDAPSFNKPKDAFSNICQDLSHLKSSYDFDKIPIHILGSIYERFLGKVVHATPKRVTIEEKPEVKKAGGVYYTPRYIVRYIVANTVGKLLEGKTPLQISRLRFADIACGSGSFLIGVFETLLDYHNNWYQNNPAKAKSDGCFHQDGKWILSLQQKKNILLNNIYGVDIDSQAVEVTQLSLCLKLMEDETTATANEMQVLFHEQILPDLTKNIVCGNSLIGWDIEDGQLFPDEEMRKLNPMDFENAFSEIMGNGGFDAIVGNPPYVDCRENENVSKEYWKTKYFSASYGKTNTYEIFLEKGISILKENGLIGYILPIVLLNVESCKQNRKLLLKYKIDEIAFGEFSVFKKANVDTTILLLIKALSNKNEKIRIKRFSENFNSIIKSHILPYSEIKEENGLKIPVKTNKVLSSILKKNKKQIIKISDELDFYNGIATGPNKEKYFASKKITSKYKPLIMGNSIGLYSTNFNNVFINYDRKKLHRPREENIFLANEKIIMQRIRNLKLERRIVATLDTNKFYTFNSVNNLLIKSGSQYNIRYFLGIINSTLLNYLLKQLSLNTNITKSDLNLLPIRSINLQNKTEKAQHDKIVRLVDQMLEAKKKLATAKIDRDINYYERKCSNIDREINNEVYKLYNLSKDEIEIIKNS